LFQQQEWTGWRLAKPSLTRLVANLSWADLY